MALRDSNTIRWLALGAAALLGLAPALWPTLPADPRARALHWLARAEAGRDTASPLILDYLHRRFGVARCDALLAQARAAADAAQAPYLRMIDAAHHSARLPTEQEDPFGWPLLAALYCDRHPLPADFLGRLDALSASGGYHLTHAALGLDWALEMGCVDGARAAALREQQNALLARLPEAQGLGKDQSLEALAILLRRGEHARVDGALIARLRRSQHASGAWTDTAADNRLHRTVLALWTLLEWAQPAPPAAPMIAPAIQPPSSRAFHQ